jgi:hypothetical protein
VHNGVDVVERLANGIPVADGALVDGVAVVSGRFANFVEQFNGRLASRVSISIIPRTFCEASP